MPALYNSYCLNFNLFGLILQFDKYIDLPLRVLLNLSIIFMALSEHKLPDKFKVCNSFL